MNSTLKVFINILFIVYITSLYAQSERKPIVGILSSKEIDLQNIHVINTTSKHGTISDLNGKFSVLVKENDTLEFSSVQIIKKKVIISQSLMTRDTLKIYLIPNLISLEEVNLETKKNLAKSLNLPNADKKPLSKLEARMNYYSQESTPIVILSTLLGKKGGIEDIYYILSGNRKKDRNFKKIIEYNKQQDLNNEVFKQIRIHFRDEFFINVLKVPKEKIDFFIQYCEPYNIVKLYEDDNFLELTDIFIKVSRTDFLSEN